MRWDAQLVNDQSGDGLPVHGRARPALFGLDQVVRRTVDAPAFAGITFHEVRARSLLNRVPPSSRVPFRWTVNPYRGCSHACRYCFARSSHRYLDLDTGHDFDSQIVVKVNAPEVLRRELAAPGWRGEPVAMGTNVDCYQRAEGRYGLMRGILGALVDAANPFSILTKGTLILRDLDLIAAGAQAADVSAAVSVGSLDAELACEVEPGTPRPRARLEVCRRLTAAGIRCGVLVAPILPYLSDSPARLRAVVAAAAQAGAAYVSPVVLHLRPGVREWFSAWLATAHPELVAPYRRMYGGRAYAPAAYQARITAAVHALAEEYGIPGGRGGVPQPQAAAPPPAPAPGAPVPGQLTLA